MLDGEWLIAAVHDSKEDNRPSFHSAMYHTIDHGKGLAYALAAPRTMPPRWSGVVTLEMSCVRSVLVCCGVATIAPRLDFSSGSVVEEIILK